MIQSKPPVLYTYWRSSASYRVRMALNLKGIDYQTVPVHLVRDGGQQHAPEYAERNPQRLVPALTIDGITLTQSLAMLEYLDETVPEPALLPADAAGRARVRALAQAIASDIHPLNNLRVLKYLTGPAGLDDEAKMAWYRHWTETGLAAVEAMLAGHSGTGEFCHGDRPGLADCCLLPQVYNARRFECRLDGLDHIERICANLERIEAVREAAPENQPDAE